MRRVVIRALVLAAGLGIGVTSLTASELGVATGAVSPHAHKVLVKFVGIDRNGDRVPVFANVITMSGASVILGSSAGRLAPGQYIVAADVLTDQGEPSASQAMVVRHVVVKTGTTILLDARTARPVTVALNVAGAQQQSLNALIMDPRTQVMLAGAGGSAGTVYVTPAALPQLCFSVSSRWHTDAGHFYDLLRTVRRRVPSDLAFNFQEAKLATVRLTVRSGLSQGFIGFFLQPAGCAAGLTVEGLTAPVQETDSMSAATWTAAEEELYGTGDSITRTERTGRSAAISLGDAVAAPAGQFPFAFPAGQFQFQNSDIFSYPPGGQFPAGECCAASTGQLRVAGHVVATEKFTSPQGLFVTTLRRSGWYTFGVKSRRVDLSSHHPLTDVLSPRVDVSWRFYATPESTQGYPLTLATYEPVGLNAENSAPAGATTTLRILISRPGDSPGTPVYALKSVRLEVSGDGGLTWASVRVTRRGRAWIARIPDPVNGQVSLRSTVTDVHGDSTTETIYQAYGIS
jgi:hypothetical protein